MAHTREELRALEGTYNLRYEASSTHRAVFRKISGEEIDSVTLHGRTRNLLYPKPSELGVEITPKEALPAKELQKVRIVLGPGRHSRRTSELDLNIFNPGIIYCANDLYRMKPHPHQAMPGEKTPFVFHLTNVGKAATSLSVSAVGLPEPWKPRFDRTDFKRVETGETRMSVLSLGAPSDSAAGQTVQFDVRAESSSVERRSVRVRSTSATGETSTTWRLTP